MRPTKEFLFFLLGFVVSVLSLTMVFFEFLFMKDFPNQKVTYNSHTLLYAEEVSDEIFRDVKVLCLVMTYPANHKTKAVFVKETWGMRCNKLLFMTNEHDPLLETVIINQNETRDLLWGKTKKSFQYAFDQYFDEFDWFLKADDDTYMVMENLRYMLLQYNPGDSLYFGHRYAAKSKMPSGYMAGGGYVLSKAALKAFVEEINNPESHCLVKYDKGDEDWEMGFCLQGIATKVDCRDEKHEKRFFPVGVEAHMEKNMDFTYWYFRTIHYNSTQGKLSCCSETVAEMHYINPKEMFAFEYFIYNVHPFGTYEVFSDVLPKKLEWDEIVEASNAAGFRQLFAKQIRDQALQQKEKNRKVQKELGIEVPNSSDSDSLDKSLENLKI